MILTTEKIHAKITEIYEKTGEITTQSKLREALGGGSFTTIGEALKSWKDNMSKEQELSKVQLPSDLEARVLQFAAATWDQAIDDANVRLKTERAALQEAREEFETRESELNESINVLEDEAEQLREKITKLENMLEEEARERRSTASELERLVVASETKENALREQIESSDAKFNQLVEAMQKNDSKK